jgi:hypothetical protein
VCSGEAMPLACGMHHQLYKGAQGFQQDVHSRERGTWAACVQQHFVSNAPAGRARATTGFNSKSRPRPALRVLGTTAFTSIREPLFWRSCPGDRRGK